MSLRPPLVFVLAALCALCCFAAAAQAHKKPPKGPKVIASGLDNPRGLAFGPEGALYVTESGRGGSGPPCRIRFGSPFCYGPTGAISRLWRGKQEKWVTGLPSMDESNNPVLKATLIGEEWMALRQIAFGAEPARIPQSVRTRLEDLGLVARDDYGLMLTRRGAE